LSIQTASTATPRSKCYVYDGVGMRQSENVCGAASSLAVQETWNTLNSTPGLLRDGLTYFIFDSSGHPIEEINGTTAHYFAHDAFGSTRGLFSNAGQLTDVAQYMPGGVQIASYGGDVIPIGFGGTYKDSESSLLYMVHRYYDPVTAQFVSVDPALGVTGQPYSYASGDPVNGVDPLGLAPYCGPGDSGPCLETGASRPEIAECDGGAIGRSASLCSHIEVRYSSWLAGGGGKPWAGDTYLASTFSICANGAWVEGCIAFGGGHAYLEGGPGIGTPGVSASFGGVINGCARDLLGGPSIHAGGQFFVGGGWSQALTPLSGDSQGARDPDISVGTPGIGAFVTYGFELG